LNWSVFFRKNHAKNHWYFSLLLFLLQKLHFLTLLTASRLSFVSLLTFRVEVSDHKRGKSNKNSPFYTFTLNPPDMHFNMPTTNWLFKALLVNKEYSLDKVLFAEETKWTWLEKFTRKNFQYTVHLKVKWPTCSI